MQTFAKQAFFTNVEPKRIKAIIQEVEAALAQGQGMKGLNSKEPYYLIALPFLWQEQFPLQPPSITGGHPWPDPQRTPPNRR